MNHYTVKKKFTFLFIRNEFNRKLIIARYFSYIYNFLYNKRDC